LNWEARNGPELGSSGFELGRYTHFLGAGLRVFTIGNIFALVCVEQIMKAAISNLPSRGVIAEWTVTLIVFLFGTTSLVQAFVIPTGSMENTLLVGDHVLVDKLAYAPTDAMSRHILPYEEVKRGDIIVFRHPITINETLVKRAMGIPGDRLRLENKQLFLNGKPLNESRYVIHSTHYIDSYRDNFPTEPNTALPPRALAMLEQNVSNHEVVVPPGSVFAMGDNRDNSSDSRYWGFVPRENIVGKPLMIYWSYDASTEDLMNPNPFALEHVLDLAEHFLTKTRWDRTLKFTRGEPLE
jgi:signal peptidase I